VIATRSLAASRTPNVIAAAAYRTKAFLGHSFDVFF
jgi:hypothetical protein